MEITLIIFDFNTGFLLLALFFIFYFIWKFKDRIKREPEEEEELPEEPEEEEPEEEEELPEEPEEEEELPEEPEEEEPEEEEELPEEPEEEEPEKTRRKRKQISPPKRGGRPRVTQKSTDVTARQTQYQWRPTIVCWQRERQWFVGVEVIEDILDEDLKLYQDNLSLKQDEFDDCRWILNEATCPVEIIHGEGEEYSIALKNIVHIFKITGSEQIRGHWVRYPSYGSFFVIVPETWERNVELSGSPPVTPQPVSLKGYQGHFFYLDKGDDRKIAFYNEKKELVPIESEKSRFEIMGNILNDYSEFCGPLFGDGPIMIKSLNERGWSDVGTVVIGEEGAGRGRWRYNYNPVDDALEQSLPSEVISRQSGWYFIRFYDLNDDLIESLDFRFVNGLKDIKTLETSIIPSEEGHIATSVQISHASNIDIRPKGDIKDIEISRDLNTTTLTIPPKCSLDLTSWVVAPELGPPVELNVLIEHIWWSIGGDDESPLDWEDKPITLSRDDFTPTSSKSLYIRFPKPRWIDSLLIGFNQNRTRSFNIKVEEKMIGIPLRDFGDSNEIENEVLNADLSIWLNRGTEVIECRLASLPSVLQYSEFEENITTEYDGIGYGRKRRATAKATLKKGLCEIIVNNRPLWDYFEDAPEKAKVFMRRLLQIEDVGKVLINLQVRIIVVGSAPNTMQQLNATTHALSRALMGFDPQLKILLKRMNDFGGVRVRSLPIRRKK